MREADVGVDISLVTYQPDFDLLQQLLESLAEGAAGVAISLYIHDNSPESDITDRIASLPLLGAGGVFKEVDIGRSTTNVGFGRGNNAAAAHGRAPFVLVINQDCVLEPGALARVLDVASNDDAKVAAWELRQIPYEHPKAYDPVTLDTPWVSGAALAVPTQRLRVGRRIRSRIFMYGEDVDLSWRLRAAGWRLRYVPRVAVVHRTYRSAGEVKPLQALGGVRDQSVLASALRRRCARWRRASRCWRAEMLAPQDFPGRRRGLIKALSAFSRALALFRSLTRVRRTETFRAPVLGLGLRSATRRGVRCACQPARETATRLAAGVDPDPHGRSRRVVEAGAGDGRQSDVAQHRGGRSIEDGPPNSATIVEAFRDRLAVRYRATGDKVGRARAGNLALADARGEWLNFLDDDDVFFADHVEC